MKLPALLCFAVVALLAAGCGQVVTVGVPCTSRADCVAGQACVLEAPGGVCTRGCTEPGATTECPAGTTCIYFGNAQLQCAPLCASSAECRINYECVAAGGTTAAMACRPANVTR